MKLNIKITQPVAIFCTLIVLSFLGSCHAASLTIANNGKSTFSIIVPKVAAKSVNDAATELQLDIQEATGAKLPVVTDNTAVSGSFISLGSTKQAASAGISALNIPPGGFRVITKNGNLFIIGLDTTAIDIDRRDGRPSRESSAMELHPEIPGPAFTKDGGISQGTANGVYTFLEEELGVRWLMPGDIGRDVPARKSFQVDETDTTQTPEFAERVIYALGGGNVQSGWRDHQKLGASLRVNALHSWSRVVPPSMYDQHPEWFAMDSSGNRPKPTGLNYKLETTNPELVTYFAKKAIEALKAQPQLNTFSLSPTDSGGWSQSPQSKPYYDPPYPGEYGQIVTRLVMKFYNDVSAIVAKEYPQGKLAGYIYGNYRFAPTKGGISFPDNFIPELIPEVNGYTMYRPEVQKTALVSYFNEWSKYLPKTWVFYTHPLWLRSTDAVALVTPAAPKSLNAIFSTFVKYGASGGIVYGSQEWGASALKNYILAQMLWNPKADATAIQHDWLMRAYGPDAGAVMEEFYNNMDAHWFSDARRNNVGANGFIRAVYGEHYPQMEALFLKAWNQPMTAKQKERLGLIKEQMTVLQWMLRNEGYLSKDYNSPLETDARQVFKIITTKHNFLHFDGALRGALTPEIKNVAVRLSSNPVGTQEAQNSPIPNDKSILLFPTENTKVILRPTEVSPGRNILFYSVKDTKGKIVNQGILSPGDDVVFQAKANEPYYFAYRSRGPQGAVSEWNITIPHSAIVTHVLFNDDIVNLYVDKPQSSSLYVYVPKELSLQTETKDSAVVVHTPTAVQKNKTKNYLARVAAHSARVAALKRYKAALWVDLDYGWRFQTDPKEQGEKQGYEKPGFYDGLWKGINANGSWQDLGFKGYYGTAWYRKTFNPFKPGDEPMVLAGRKVLLFFGAVDGDAVFYLNGKKIGEHKMTDPSTSWQVPIVFDVTDIVHGDSNNTIAVKVTKDRLASGIYKGVSLLVGILP